MRVLVFAGLAACITPSNTFPCASDEDCSGGHCELATSFCSFADSTCPDGSRYGDAAGDLSNTCVGGTTPVNCGNGVVDADEDCDDDSALCVGCKRPRCGDGDTFVGVEECDDGNTMDGDGCNGNCLICPTGSVTHDGHCYWVVETPRLWSDAGLDCAAGHGYLVSIADATENTFVNGLIATATDYWIGVTTSFANGGGSAKLYNEDGSATVFWSGTMPAPTQNTCGAMTQTTGVWTVQDCTPTTGTVTHPYICERSPWTTSIDTKRAYLAVTGRQRILYDPAKAACAALPGSPHLVTIGDAAEQTLIDGITGASQTWIGADDLAAPATFTFSWVTGEAFSFNNFAGGVPDMTAGNNCVAIRDDGVWQNRSCDRDRSYVCELEFP